MAEENHKTHQKWLCNILHGENPEVPDYSDFNGLVEVVSSGSVRPQAPGICRTDGVAGGASCY